MTVSTTGAADRPDLPDHHAGLDAVVLPGTGLVADAGGPRARVDRRPRVRHPVMGTGTATQRIAPGQVITVDGDDGTVELGQPQHNTAHVTRKRPTLHLPAAAVGVIGLVILTRWLHRRHTLILPAGVRTACTGNQDCVEQGPATRRAQPSPIREQPDRGWTVASPNPGM
jgi:hypothetical protein